jgi:hypothetical protein
MTRDEQDDTFATYASNLQASMNRHPAGKKREYTLEDACRDIQLDAQWRPGLQSVGTPIHDGLVLEQYEQPPTPNRYASALAATYGLFILAFILLWVLS